MYCWGNSQSGQLGLNEGEDEEDQLRKTSPTFNEFFAQKNVKKVASGPTHSLFLLDDGIVYSSGDNEFNQLGRSSSSTKPKQILALETQIITEIAVGRFFSASLNRAGQLFIWGSVTGRLNEKLNFSRPTHIVPSSGEVKFVQIACGYHFLLALGNDGRVFSMGVNDFGQLGLEIVNNSYELKQIKCIEGIPVRQISCGAFHSLILTASGFIFSFGKNENGQLGLGDSESRGLPTPLKMLNGLKVNYQLKIIALTNAQKYFLSIFMKFVLKNGS